MEGLPSRSQIGLYSVLFFAWRGMNHYKAWVATAPKSPLKLAELSYPALKDEEVEVKVEHCGLCHSDLSMLNNDWKFTEYPAVFGHEIIGTIVGIGAAVKGLKVGQRVGIGWTAESCMHCDECIGGQQHLCGKGVGVIVGEHRGGFASHVRAHWAWAIALPDQLNAREAGPLLCGGITVFNPIMMYAKPTDRVGVVGIGGLGHMAVMFAAAYGCEVTALTSHPGKFDEARKIGAHAVGNSCDPEDLKRFNSRFDLVIVTANVSLDWTGLVNTLAPNGRLHIVGAVLDAIPVFAMPLIVGQKSISGSPTGSPIALRRMFEFAARHKIAPMNEHFPMSKINEAFDRLADGKARYRIVLDADF